MEALMNDASTSPQTTNALWSGRFDSSPDAAMMRFSTSLPFDARLWKHDIRGSLAHVRALEAARVLAGEERAQIETGLHAIYADIESGALSFNGAPDEDIHSFIERNLTERIGAVAGKLHTGRSRNDQIALDVRLYLREAINETREAVAAFARVLALRAEENIGTVLPGYTHLQRAQPVSLAHHLLAYAQMLARDDERLSQCYARADVLPLGAAALAGSTFPVDRHEVARDLGFSRASENSMDTVSDRDHLIESVSALSIIALHLSRLAEEIVLWSTPEWGFVTVHDRFSTGSSIMPQKKNPDSMELVRGKSARVIGDLNTLLVLVKALPLTYNRDLQEDKEPLFDAFDTTISCLHIARGVMETLTFHADKMRAAAGGGFSTATDVADYLVREGVPFRQAHEIVGAVVRYCEQQKKELEHLTLQEWQSLDAHFDARVLAVVQVESSVNARDVFGGTAFNRVREQLENVKKRWNMNQ
jgi:argininosuccinate lyase